MVLGGFQIVQGRMEANTSIFFFFFPTIFHRALRFSIIHQGRTLCTFLSLSVIPNATKHLQLHICSNASNIAWLRNIYMRKSLTQEVTILNPKISQYEELEIVPMKLIELTGD